MDVLLEIGEQVKAGRTGSALAVAKLAVRDRPSDPSCRIALSVLFAAVGDFGRALDQWKLALDLGCGAGFAHYGVMIHSEFIRCEVFRGRVLPTFLDGCDDSRAKDWIEGLEALEQGDPSRLVALSESVDKLLDGIHGQNRDFDFEGFRCCDSRTSWFVEGVFEGEYRWVPLTKLRRIRVPDRPELLGDLLWLPVSLQLFDERLVVGHLFATTPFTAIRGNCAEQMARTSGWDETMENLDIGLGLQLFGVGSEIVPVFRLGDCKLYPGTEAQFQS